jgi:hypothetical protein
MPSVVGNLPNDNSAKANFPAGVAKLCIFSSFFREKSSKSFMEFVLAETHINNGRSSAGFTTSSFVVEDFGFGRRIIGEFSKVIQ